jgi:hypothetical protein
MRNVAIGIVTLGDGRESKALVRDETYARRVMGEGATLAKCPGRDAGRPVVPQSFAAEPPAASNAHGRPAAGGESCPIAWADVSQVLRVIF